MKIITKFTLSFLIVALLVLAVGFVSAMKSRKILQDTIGNDSVLIAHNALDKIDRAVFNRIEELQVYCKDETVQIAIAKSNEEFGKLENIKNYIDVRDAKWISLPKETLSAFMQQIMSTELSRELKEKAAFYEEKYGYRVFAEIFVTNKYGANIAQTGKTSDYRQDDEEWWLIARKDGFHLTDVGYDASADVYSIDICLRIDDENGNFLGVMKTVLNIEEVISIVKKMSQAKNKEHSGERVFGHEGHKFEEYILLTQHGKTIFSAEKSEFLKDAPDILASLLKKEARPGYLIVEGFEHDEGKKLIAHAHSEGYRDFEGLGWMLVVMHETEEIFSPVADLWNFMMLMIFAVTAASVLLGVFISRSVAAPIMKLKEKMLEVGEGRLDTTIDITSNDEVGILATSFNSMIEHLRESTTSIEALNKEILEREKTEESLRQSREELEEAYTELKATQNKILQQEKMASVGQLAAGVAHEINNPMGFILSNLRTLGKYRDRLIGFIDLQSEALESLNVAKVLENIREERKKAKVDYIINDIGDLITESLDGADRVKKIVQNLKSFSRIDEADEKSADINECLESAVTIVWNELKYKAEIKKEYEDLPSTECNPQELNQVFMNFLVNAAQAIDKQGEITIRTRHADGFIYVSVADTGCGIPDDKLDRIFEPFFTTKDVGKGTGLGLSISYDIVKKHGGEILVESEEGKGTTFTVKLPVVGE